MAKGKELSVWGPVTENADGTERGLDQASEEEKESFREQICQRVSQSLSVYYSAHRDEWEEFIRTIQEEK